MQIVELFSIKKYPDMTSLSRITVFFNYLYLITASQY